MRVNLLFIHMRPNRYWTYMCDGRYVKQCEQDVQFLKATRNDP